VTEAIESALRFGHYAEARQLIQALDPQEPRTQIYLGLLHEAQQQWEQAETIYRHLLRDDHGPKAALAARQGLERLSVQRTEDRQQAITQAMTSPENTELGILILKGIPAEQKAEAAQHMAQIMNIDPYSARMILPSRGLRLYRSGAIGELEYYGQQLKQQGIPVFWVPLSTLERIPVYTVSYFESIANPVRAMVQTHGAATETRSIQFTWSDVVQRVEGQLPIFEEVVDRDPRGKLQRKEKTQDHSQFCDLHLAKQNCILRLYDTAYQFTQGIALGHQPQRDQPQTEQSHQSLTSWANWRLLSQMISQKLPQQTVWSDFEFFAENALDHPDLLAKLPSHINLFRREESDWDPAFQLYSSVLFAIEKA
jgi:tetratricopeptide (TPR) repeat protein